MAEIQRRQSDVQKTQAGLVERLLEYRQQTEKNLAHVTVRFAEITNKLAMLQGHGAYSARPGIPRSTPSIARMLGSPKA